MKVRDVIRQIEEVGWVLDRTHGSHRQYVHPEQPGVVTVAAHPNDDIHPKTLRSILQQAGIRGRNR